MIDSIIFEDIEKIKGCLKKEDFKGKHVLVTGGAGFIGSWICDVLTDLDADIVCLDNFSTGKIENVNHLMNKTCFNLIERDVCNFHGKVKYDYILHLASRASPEEYQQNPIETLRTNSLGSYNVLELARKHDAGIVFTSTSEVYGDAQVIPTPETYWGNVNPTGVRSCYDEGKRFGEALFMAYYKKYGLDVKIARIFNTFGPRLRADGAYGRAVSRFIDQALFNQSLTVFGDGKQTRSFCYVADTVLALLLFCANNRVSGEVLNVGNPEEITILELAHKIKQMSGSASPITFHPLPEDDPKRRCPDIKNAEKFLGWRPKFSLELGLRRTMAWFQRSAKLVQAC